MKRADAFLTVPRELYKKRKVEERIKNFREFIIPLEDAKIQEQAERCMDCGVPFCHTTGCPLESMIPTWNARVHAGRWQEALQLLEDCNIFPEFTGRVCPAPCESACTLAVHNEPVTIQQIELAIIEHGFSQGWIKPNPPKTRLNKRIAVVGSGPAGLAVAQRLNRLGYWVTVFEKSDRLGGLLRYGIPDFKLEKHIVDRRINLMQEEGVEFLTELEAGVDLSARYLLKYYDALCLTGGSETARHLDIAGTSLDGVCLAMDFLSQQNLINAGGKADPSKRIDAADKVCVILGGGDTGADCIGTARRQGAKEIYQFEILPKPPESRTAEMPWPTHPKIHRLGSSHEEGCIQRFNICTKELIGREGKLKALKAVEVDFVQSGDKKSWQMKERPNTEFELPVDLVILALGFLGPKHNRLLKDLNVELDDKGLVKTDAELRTTTQGVYCAGDMNLGPALVVTAIQAGKVAARTIHRDLQ